MKIIYSPYFACEVYTSLKGVRFGEIFTGSAGLLEEMELRAGLSAPVNSAAKRQVAYYKAIKKLLKLGARPFFRESFEKDGLGVASELLKWRDALVLAGWKAEASDEESKLRDLASIEAEFDCMGEPDRWKLLSEAKDELKGWTVEVRIPRDAVSKLIREALEASGAEVTYADFKGIDLKQKIDDIGILTCADREDAYRWAARQTFGAGTLLVNRDSKAFNDILRAEDKPLVHSEFTDSNPPAIQLFKFVLNLFKRPVDLRNLLDFLNCPVCPVPSAIRNDLLLQLKKEGGFGQSWSDKLNKADEAGKKIPTALLNLLSGLASNTTEKQPEGAKTSELRAVMEGLGKWSLKYAGARTGKMTEDTLESQLRLLAGLCDLFEALLEDAGDTVDHTTLSNWANALYSPGNFPDAKAELGSPDTIRDIRAVAEGPDHLVWLDCNAEKGLRYPYDFLGEEEAAALKDRGVEIPDREILAKAENLAVKAALLLVKGTADLVVSSTARGARLDENPVVTEIKALKNLKDTTALQPPQGESLPFKQLPGPVLEFHLEKGLEIVPREKGESYSSVDCLIQRPFDYVMDYILGLKDSSIESDIKTVQGNVAHAVISRMATINKDTGRSDFGYEEIEALVEDEISANGLLLLEDRWTYDGFCRKLTESSISLFRQIGQNGFKVFGTELEVTATLPTIKEPGSIYDGKTLGLFNAKIDLLIENGRGELVLIDLKWSSSSKYRQKINDKTDLQLALYRKVVETAYPEKKIIGGGYYLIPEKKIETRDIIFRGWQNAEVLNGIVPESSASICSEVYAKAVRSCEFRRWQLSRGVVEMAEKMPLDPQIDERTSEYMKAFLKCQGSLFFPLGKDYHYNRLKAEAYGHKNYILKERSV